MGGRVGAWRGETILGRRKSCERHSDLRGLGRFGEHFSVDSHSVGYGWKGRFG